MAAKWFVQKNDLIDGPLTTADVHARIEGGQLLPQHLIWARGLDQWFTIQAWQTDANFSALASSQPMFETWHFALNGESTGPISREALIMHLKGLPTLASVMLWTKGMSEWAPLFEFHDILTEVGVNKRQFPRADLTGKAVLKTTDGSTLVAPLVSISEGGFGIQLEAGVASGQIVTAELHSPAFREVLNVKAELRYGSQGVLGMKFTQVSPETKGAIIQFVRQTQVRFTLKSA